jgi:hypothetical protein
MEFINHLSVPFLYETKIAIHQQLEGKSTFYFPNPCHFASFTSPRSVLDQAKLGFTGELFILFAGSLGLSTCWMGHFNAKLASSIVYGNTEASNQGFMFCTTPLGTPPSKSGLLTKMSARLFSKKKAVADHLTAGSISNIPPAINTALDLACKAPSALNNPCWYYTVRETPENYEVELGKPNVESDGESVRWHFIMEKAVTLAI